MSAYIVDKRHIDALITAADRHAGRLHDSFTFVDNEGNRHILSRTGEDSTQVSHYFGRDIRTTYHSFNTFGAYLWQENTNSVNARYAEQSETEAYHWRGIDVTTIQALKAVDCYEYQSCEHEGWNGSLAQSFCTILRKRLVQDLPGYDDGHWHITEQEFPSTWHMTAR